MPMVPGPPPPEMTMEKKEKLAKENAKIKAVFIKKLNNELLTTFRSEDDRVNIICAILKG